MRKECEMIIRSSMTILEKCGGGPYEDVRNIDHETFSSSTYDLTTGQVVGPTLISRDDYGHIVRRSIVAQTLFGKQLKAYEHLISECVDNLIQRFSSRSVISLVKEFGFSASGRCYFCDLGDGWRWALV